jgi:hypothetical protein
MLGDATFHRERIAKLVIDAAETENPKIHERAALAMK